MKSDFYYQAFTCDLAAGQTYVSNVHNGKKVFRAGISSASIDNITYTRESQLVADIRCLRDRSSTAAAFRAFRSAVEEALAEKGYVQDDSVPRSEEKDSSDSFSAILSDIAVINRFPIARLFPLPLIYNNLSENARYMVSDIPRDASFLEMIRSLGIVLDDELQDFLIQYPDFVEAAFILNRIGCQDPEDVLYFCKGTDRHVAIAALYDIIRWIPSGRFDPMSFASVIAACSMGPGGWKAWIDGLKKQHDVFASNATAEVRQKMESLFLMGKTLPKAHSFSTLTSNIAKSSQTFPKYNIEDVIEANSFRSNILNWERRRFSADWKIKVPDSRSEWERGTPYQGRRYNFDSIAQGITKVVDVYKGDRLAGFVTIRAYCHIDRRKWNMLRQREFFELCRKLELDKNEAKRFEALEGILQDSLVMDWRLESICEADFGRPLSQGVEPHFALIIREWCKAKKIKINKGTSAGLDQSVRKWKKHHSQ